MPKKIKVLVVDDSILFRRTIIEGISKDPMIEVIAMAADPYEARDQIIAHKPDVMTLDVEMPKMDGIEFLKRLMPQYPIPTIMVSAVDDKVFEALKYGALDFVVKSNLASNQALSSFINSLTEKIKSASLVDMKSKYSANKSVVSSTIQPSSNSSNIDIIALGASTGGPEATEKVLSTLPVNLPPIVIVQHMPPVFTTMYAKRLNENCLITVKEAETGDILKSGHAYIAKGSDHLKLIKTDRGMMVKCFQGNKVNGHMPSVDVLFASVTKYYNNNALGVILTGMGNDGAKGLLAMKKLGAPTIGQDERTSIVYGMPKAAYELGAVQFQTPIHHIGKQIISICSTN